MSTRRPIAPAARVSPTAAPLVGLVAAALIAASRREAVAQTPVAQTPAAQSASARPATGATRAAVDAVVDTAARNGFAGVVLVGTFGPQPRAGALDGTAVVYARAVGLADREAGRAHAVDERWPWASVTKQVTAALVMAEVAAGRVALDSGAAHYLPELADRPAGRATVRDLLRHTTTLPNPDATPAGADSVPSFYRQTGAAVGDVAATRGYCAGPPAVTATAGAASARFSYNNCDYLVLGALLARVTGQPYATLVRDRIARPLDLRTLASLADGAPTPVPGYAADGTRAPSVNLATSGAAGALAGTARDLLALDGALATFRLVPAAATAEMWRGDRALGYVALGAWAYPAPLRGCTGAVPLVERRGEFGGVQVRNVIAPTLGRAVVVFTNSADLEFGEVWQGRGLTYALLSAALCPPSR